eukprot:NODE_470_length_1360_cov_120.940503_g339_i0.p6 GENE.NODE_470_length_1360_cov_120.940503_g339_i0~~NODE_470_length_1360_cov_120.940503_g339_i0.p6  ORF type:complete len:110 (-),score=13.12 NODE_470_length_1360_cov_120.940503_g339_i0:155-484(-)
MFFSPVLGGMCVCVFTTSVAQHLISATYKLADSPLCHATCWKPAKAPLGPAVRRPGPLVAYVRPSQSDRTLCREGIAPTVYRILFLAAVALPPPREAGLFFFFFASHLF